jgi:phosphopentomutase
LGVRETLSDISQTVADIFGIPKMKNGDSFKGSISNEK